MSQVSSHYVSPYASPQVPSSYFQLPQQNQRSRKRSFPGELSALDYQGVQQLQANAASIGVDLPVELRARGQHAQTQASAFVYPLQAQQRPSLQHSLSAHSGSSPSQQMPPPQHHHHHRLPNQPPPSKQPRTDYGEASSSAQDQGPPSVVGQEGMPLPAPKPKGPKLKFTPEDDALLVELKETMALTWKRIVDFFPGRSSGTLQVRYCTKLKAKSTEWTDEMVQKLRLAVQEYDNDRWRVISSKVGHSFSAAACKEKAVRLEEEELLNQEETEEVQTERQQAPER